MAIEQMDAPREPATSPYGWIADGGNGRADQAAFALGLSPRRAAAALQQLSDIGLTRTTRSDTHEITAVDPDAVATKSTAPLRDSIRRQEEHLEQMRSGIDRLRDRFRNRPPNDQDVGVTVVPTPEEVRAASTVRRQSAAKRWAAASPAAAVSPQLWRKPCLATTHSFVGYVSKNDPEPASGVCELVEQGEGPLHDVAGSAQALDISGPGGTSKFRPGRTPTPTPASASASASAAEVTRQCPGAVLVIGYATSGVADHRCPTDRLLPATGRRRGKAGKFPPLQGPHFLTQSQILSSCDFTWKSDRLCCVIVWSSALTTAGGVDLDIHERPHVTLIPGKSFAIRASIPLGRSIPR